MNQLALSRDQHAVAVSSLAISFYMHDFSGGGVERMRLALITELLARGIDVTLVVQLDRGPLRTLIPAGLHVVVLGASRTFSSIPALAKYMRAARHDILVASLDHNNVAALLAKLLSRTRTKVVICQHNALSLEAAAGWTYRFIPLLYRLLHKSAGAIVAVSDGVAEDLARVAKIDQKRITRIYNPVIDTGFARRAAGPPPHPWLAAGHRDAVLVFAGRLSPQKDPSTLLKAFALLQKSIAARLILVGDGSLLSALRAEAQALRIDKFVFFAGFQENPLPWLAHADALVLSSVFEGFGNVIVEALACGTPVVATDCPWGPAEILSQGAYGMLAECGNPSSLARAMQDCLAAEWNPSALARFGASFSAASCADRHLALFKSLNEKAYRSVFGLDLSCLSAAGIVERLFAPASLDTVRLVVTPNIDHLRHLKLPAFRAAYASADLCCADGFPIVAYARARGLRTVSHVTGCELFHLIATHSRLGTQRVFIVVESLQTRQAVHRWSKANGLSGQILAVAASHDLSKSQSAEANLLTAICAYGPTMLIVTLGAPFSEMFVHRNRAALPPCWALCLGQAVRAELGLVRRASPAWQKWHLEWLWRIRQEPRRLVGRYLRSVAWFPLAVVRDLLGYAG